VGRTKTCSARNSRHMTLMKFSVSVLSTCGCMYTYRQIYEQNTWTNMTHMCTYKRKFIRTYVYIYVLQYMYVCTCKHYTYECIHTQCAYIHMYMHAHTYKHTYTQTNMHTNIPTCIQTYIHTYINTGWRRLIGSSKLQIISHKRATKYRSLLWKMT